MDLFGVTFALQDVLLFAGPVPDLPSPGAGERYWRRADPAEARDWVARQPAGAEVRKMYEVAVAEDHRLFLAHELGVEIGHRWVGFRRAYVPWPFTCELILPPDTGYLYDVFVSPSHRGREVGAGAVGSALREIRAAGVTRCAAWVLSKNHDSVAVWRRLGVPERHVMHLALPKVRRWLPSQPWRDAGILVRRNTG